MEQMSIVPKVKASNAGRTSANSMVATPLRLWSFRDRRRPNRDADIVGVLDVRGDVLVLSRKPTSQIPSKLNYFLFSTCRTHNLVPCQNASHIGKPRKEQRLPQRTNPSSRRIRYYSSRLYQWFSRAMRLAISLTCRGPPLAVVGRVPSPCP